MNLMLELVCYPTFFLLFLAVVKHTRVVECESTPLSFLLPLPFVSAQVSVKQNQ